MSEDHGAEDEAAREAGVSVAGQDRAHSSGRLEKRRGVGAALTGDSQLTEGETQGTAQLATTAGARGIGSE